MNKDVCENLRKELEELKDLRFRLGQTFDEALKTRDFSACGELRQRIREILEGPGSEISNLGERMLPVELKKLGLKLKEQFETQVKVAWKSGLFEKEQLHVQPVIERDGKEYPMPSWSEVVQTLKKNKEIIKEKSAQGFTKMLIVPFGYDLKTMAGKFKEKVRELDQSGLNPDGSSNPGKGVFGASGEKVDFNREHQNYPVLVSGNWDDASLVYYPKQYKKNNHGGLLKDEALKINEVWQICFVEDMPIIPLNGIEVGGRKQIDRMGNWVRLPKGVLPHGNEDFLRISQYKKLMDNNNQSDDEQSLRKFNPEKYRNERGMIPEKYLWMQFTSLLSGEKPVLMDFNKNGYGGTYMTDCYNFKTNSVPSTCWSSETHRSSLGSYAPSTRDISYGVRASVDIK